LSDDEDDDDDDDLDLMLMLHDFGFSPYHQTMVPQGML